MITRREFGAALFAARELPDLRSAPPDLETPPMIQDASPAPGRRVRQQLPGWEGTQVHHALYLPTDWTAGQKHPVIVEYAGNGNFSNQFGDISTGRVDGSNFGFGASGGQRFIWLCLPYVNKRERKNEIIWWGDVDATADYCKKAIDKVCEEWSGDRESVILAGFSRGAIACNFIGLRDEEIARMWLAFAPYSHYDGVQGWEYAGSDRYSALVRLRRLRGRAQFISHEQSVDETRRYIAATGVKAPFTFQTVNFRNHSDAWTLRDVPERRALRLWLDTVLRERPGMS